MAMSGLEPIIRLGQRSALVRGSTLTVLARSLRGSIIAAERLDGVGAPEDLRQVLADLEAEAAVSSAASSPAGTAVFRGLVLPAAPADDRLSTKEAAHLLGVGERNVRGLHGRGTLRSGRKLAGRLTFDRLEIERRATARNH